MVQAASATVATRERGQTSSTPSILALTTACSVASSSASVRPMATLHLRNVPEDVAAELRRTAAGGSSMNREAIRALRRGLGLDQTERADLIREIRANRPRVDADIAAIIRAERPE